MSPEKARIAISEQAATYAMRVITGQINDSAVHGLLQADADHFSDGASAATFAHGLDVYERLTHPQEGRPK